MKKLKFMAGLVGLVLAVGMFFHPQGSAQADSVVWGTTLTSSSATPLHLLGARRIETETDSSGYKVYVYGRIWGQATINLGDVLYDTSSSANGFNYTNISPAASIYDTSGIVDTTTFRYTPRNQVAGVCLTTQTAGYYGWVQTEGLASVRMTAPLQKGIASGGGASGFGNRLYRAGMPICGSGAGVARVATVPSAALAGLQSYRTYLDNASVFGRIAVNAIADTTLVKAYIRCR